ncbi:MAG: transporter substrate-binding domain-containing protein [Mogibacterium sp.]|nr:transporter substrate-binding domain-containing protein [Mogibacterium sp.]
MINRNSRNYCIKRSAAILIVIAAFLSLVSAGGAFVSADSDNKSADQSGAVPKYKTLKELSGKRIGVQVGSVFDEYAEAKIPDVRIEYFSTCPDEVNALKASKLDGIVCLESAIIQLQGQADGIVVLNEPVGVIPLGFVYPKNEKGRKLADQMSEFLAKLEEEGELERLKEVWNGNDESVKVVDDYSSFPADNGTLTFVTEGTFPPFDYFRDGKIIGYDVDIAVRFCKEYGYGLKIKDMNFDALMPAIQSGKFDFAASGIAITEERAKKVHFSSPDYYQNAVVAVLAEGDSSGSFIASVRDSFVNTFVREHRYMLFLKGIRTTLDITVLSIIFGTLLGFILYMWCRKGGRAAKLITRFCVWLVHGLPGIVLLMLLYYVVFGKTDISGMWVAITGFTMTFAASVYSMIVSGVNAVDPGQTEASYALGFTDTQTFFGIILPQAAKHFMPAYKEEIVTLIKATAVVGYIAVQDLTKMGDIVRSRTYEAFFPLIAIAVIYFILAGVLKAVVGRLTVNVDPEKRSESKILKGIKVK